jgi:hypothetical protein
MVVWAHNTVSWAVDRLHISLIVCGWVSEGTAVVWALDTALVVIFEVAVAGVATNIVSDMAAEQWGSGLETGGWGLVWGVVGRPGNMLHCF